MPQRQLCPGVNAGAPTPTGPLQEPRLIETSGLVASPSQADVLWLHNDSGDDAVIYAVSPTGKALATVLIDGMEFRDLEDIAAGPCPICPGPACTWPT